MKANIKNVTQNSIIMSISGVITELVTCLQSLSSYDHLYYSCFFVLCCDVVSS